MTHDCMSALLNLRQQCHMPPVHANTSNDVVNPGARICEGCHPLIVKYFVFGGLRRMVLALLSSFWKTWVHSWSLQFGASNKFAMQGPYIFTGTHNFYARTLIVKIADFDSPAAMFLKATLEGVTTTDIFSDVSKSSWYHFLTQCLPRC